MRVGLFWFCYLAILVASAMLKVFLPASAMARELVWAVTSSVGVLLLTLLFLRWDRRSAADIGLRFERSTVTRFALGAAIGFALYGVHVLVVSAFGGIRVVGGGADAKAIVLATATYLALSCMEELGFRGYPLRTLHARFGLWPSQLIVAFAFALSHFAYGWPWLSIVAGVLPGGLLFGMAAIASRGLALPIALHAAWNIATWSAGEKGSPSLWQIVREPGANGVATVSFVSLFLLAAFAFWLFARRDTTAR